MVPNLWSFFHGVATYSYCRRSWRRQKVRWEPRSTQVLGALWSLGHGSQASETGRGRDGLGSSRPRSCGLIWAQDGASVWLASSYCFTSSRFFSYLGIIVLFYESCWLDVFFHVHPGWKLQRPWKVNVFGKIGGGLKDRILKVQANIELRQVAATATPL